jgi:hypothetical protein
MALRFSPVETASRLVERYGICRMVKTLLKTPSRHGDWKATMLRERAFAKQ